jgi:rubredoxin
MAYTRLKNDIAAVIKNNGNQDITGNVLQGTLIGMIDGLTEGEKCTVCGAITIPQQTVGKSNHSLEKTPAVPATCQTEGLTEGEKCSVCGYVYEQEDLPEDFVCPLCKHGACDFEKIC